MAPEGSVSLHDEKQAVGTVDGHAYCTCGADLGPIAMLVGHHQQDESSPGSVHEAADVRQTVVLERPGRAAETLAGRRQRHESDAGHIHETADVKQTIALERPRWLPAA